MTVLVSIIVPVYKVEQYLPECVDSILSQTYQNIEIILVNDGSPDRCPEICDDFRAKYKSIKVIHKENGGLASARQAGFEIATGEYILFIDSDDYIAPDMVEKLVFAIENQNSELAICGYNTVWNGAVSEHRLPYGDNRIAYRKQVERQYVLPLMGSIDGDINIPGFLCIRLHKKSLIQGSFFESERKYYVEDHIFDLLYADNVNSIAIVNEPLYFYRFNPNSLSNCYRVGKWQMYMNAVQFFRNYADERNLSETENRIRAFLSGGVFASIDNAVLSGSYPQYKRELKEIRTGVKILNFKKISVEGYWGRRIIKVLFILHLDRCLYGFRKKRISNYYG